MRTAIVGLGFIGVFLISVPGKAATILATSCFSPSSSCYASTCTLGGATGASTSTAWPGCAIQQAINVAASGDTIVVDSGYWNVTTGIEGAKAITLQGGDPTPTNLLFQGGSLSFGTQNSFTRDIKITGLTFNGLTGGTMATIHNCLDCAFTENLVLVQPEPAVASIQFMGGADTRISSNKFTGPTGGNQLQINPLGTPSNLLPVNNSGFDVSGNVFDSVGLYEIGMSNIRIHDNYMVNTANGTYGRNVGISFAPPFGGTAYNLSIYNNYINAANANYGDIHGYPQDNANPGSYYGVFIYGNIINSTRSMIYVTTDAESSLATSTGLPDTYDVVIANNILKSYSYTASLINVDGGSLSGSVHDVVVIGNLLLSVGAHPNCIHYDTNTSNMSITSNASPSGWESGCAPG